MATDPRSAGIYLRVCTTDKGDYFRTLAHRHSDSASLLHNKCDGMYAVEDSLKDEEYAGSCPFSSLSRQPRIKQNDYTGAVKFKGKDFFVDILYCSFLLLSE